ncbi:MAG TPA: SH3 domain-containing protein, partial [Candidatus Acidoferrum sp.]|nr:SH3 domain-containing protein [Candidatus Acidoferrum sp.]
MQRIERALLNLAASGGLLVFATAGEAALSGRIARAERVESRREARVFASPGESSRVVTRVRPGKEMQVLQRRNRWLRVRVNGRTGWITRTNVIPVELVEAAPRRTRRYPFVEGRGVRRDGPSSAPRDRVGADATDAGSVDDAGELAPRERRRAALQRGKAIHRRAVDDVAADPAAVVDGPATRGELDGEEVEERFDVRIRPQARDEAGEAGAPEAADDTAVDDAFDPPVHATARDEADGPRAALARPDRPRHLEATKAREVVVVKVDEAVLRAEPSPSSALVASAESGTRLLVLERVGTWIK